jgi:ferredoxin-NADP reductase
MEILKAKVIGRVQRTATVESFRFAPEKRVEFVAGQFMQVMFDPGNAANKDLNKYLSLSCAPEREYIEVTKRLSESAFSQRLKGLRVGDEVTLRAPLGQCVFKEEYGKIAFLTGGIGITPAISIIEHIVIKGLRTDVMLLYSNRVEEEIAFRKELDGWRAGNANIRIFYTVTDCEPRDKRCMFGQIDKCLLEKNIPDCAERTVFVYGPPKMVEAMRGVCAEAGCGDDRIKWENFVGY